MYAQTRKQLIQKIHIAKSQLKLDDDAYRSLLRNATNKTSCTQMSDKELMIVLQRMQQNGFKVQRKKNVGKRPTVGSQEKQRELYLKKLEAMILDNNLTWEYVQAICRKSVKVTFVQWCKADDLRKIVQILASHLHKQGKRVK
ncbi:regulatory protein GemA [Pasteurella skyensis]|uniref:Regulatory protein GemA n=1 Tax=Phocoenobacter skyensis TaxID=97481 RepID=A0AAJ6P365_9PAST|nr:regulatory protein GemA [Pasteurella skyensis]MDP8171527.1 regulatory protein GemA [Pasteurella skyensis]MDP8175429.1 regulatory protein GemA [Pasteurella skyensis]